MTLKKLLYTIKGIRKTSAHHYGDSAFSIFIFIYYSLFKINTFILFKKELDGELLDPGLDPEFKVIKPTIEELITRRKGLNLPREFYYDEIHGVRNVYLLLKDNEIAYIHWVYLKGDPNRFLNLREGAAELNYNTTTIKFRGRGLSGKMMRYIFMDLRRQGFKNAYGVINMDNLPSIKSAHRSGFIEFSRIKAYGIFNRKVHV